MISFIPHQTVSWVSIHFCWIWTKGSSEQSAKTLRQEDGSFGSRQRSREGEMPKLQRILLKLFFSQCSLSRWLQRNRGYTAHSFVCLFEGLLWAPHGTRCQGYNQWARQPGPYHPSWSLYSGQFHPSMVKTKKRVLGATPGSAGWRGLTGGPQAQGSWAPSGTHRCWHCRPSQRTCPRPWPSAGPRRWVPLPPLHVQVHNKGLQRGLLLFPEWQGFLWWSWCGPKHP